MKNIIKANIENFKNWININCKSSIQQYMSEKSDKESDESETESDDTEELEIKGKIYIREGTNVYVKNKKGLKGELYGTWNASTNKVKKISAPKNIEV